LSLACRSRKRLRQCCAGARADGTDAAAFKAQNRVLAAGKKLSDQEKFKREEHPFDSYERLKELGARNEYPKPPDNFRWRFFGLFYVAPNQNSYMCRLRIPNGILKAAQFDGVADLAERMAAATPMSPRGPICRSARSKRITPSR
jgi:ferredoxin-nitrite reductase